MDCDDVTLLLAAEHAPTLTGAEAARFHEHIADCDVCRELAAEPSEDRFRWIARIPDDALDDPDLLVLPTVDPVLFVAERELARGGMGRITRARDRRLGRVVAIKEVLSPELRARFEREVSITAQLQHPAIVPVYEAGAWPDGSAFYTMRLVAGGTLGDAIAKTTTLEQRLALLPHVIAATDALAYAHSRGVVHRDLKPGNVLVGEFGETLVIDWGLAKELHRDVDDADRIVRTSTPELTLAGSVMGTPGFLSPEQAAGGTVDERTDVFALGAILYSVLVGHPPYCDRGTPPADELVALVRDRPPPPLAELAPRVPADLRAIVDRAMARDMTARYRTAKEMAEELRRFEAGQLVRSREYRMRDLVARWVGRHRAAVIVGAIALLVVAGIGIAAILGITRSRAVAEQNVVTLLEEQGRDRLLAGDRDRGFAYLAEAYARGDSSIAMRHLLAVATRDLDLRDAVVATRGIVKAAGFTADGRLVTVDDSPVIASAGRIQPLDAEITDAWFDPAARRAIVVLRGGGLAAYDVATGRALWSIADPALIVPHVELSADGALLLVFADLSQNRTDAQLRDAATGTLVATLSLDPVSPTAAAFSPDGHRVAICTSHSELFVWELPAGKRTELAGARCASLVRFLDNDRIVAQFGWGDVRVWRLDGSPPIQFGGHVGSLVAIAVSAATDQIATGDENGVVRLWTSYGELLGEARDHHGRIRELAFSPDGTRIAAGGADKRTVVWDAVALESLRALEDDQAATLARLAWSPDGARLATVRGASHTAIVWRSPAGHRVAHVHAWASDLTADHLVSGTAKKLLVARLDSGAQAGQIEVNASSPPDRIFASPDGARAVVQYFGTHTLASYDLATGAAIATAHYAEHIAVAISRDARFRVEAGPQTEGPMTVRVIEAASGRVAREIPASSPGVAVPSPDGDRVIVLPIHGPPQLVQIASGTATPLAPFDRPPIRAVFDPSGRRAVVFHRGGGDIIDASTGATLAVLPRRIDGAAFGGDRLATVGDGNVTVWDAAGVPLSIVDGVVLEAFALSADGQRLATGAHDGSIRITEAATGRVLELLPGDGPDLVTLRWSADDTRLVAQRLGDGFASIWDVHLEERTPVQIRALPAHWRVADGLLVPAHRSP